MERSGDRDRSGDMVRLVGLEGRRDGLMERLLGEQEELLSAVVIPLGVGDKALLRIS